MLAAFASCKCGFGLTSRLGRSVPEAMGVSFELRLLSHVWRFCIAPLLVTVYTFLIGICRLNGSAIFQKNIQHWHSTPRLPIPSAKVLSSHSYANSPPCTHLESKSRSASSAIRTLESHLSSIHFARSVSAPSHPSPEKPKCGNTSP